METNDTTTSYIVTSNNLLNNSRNELHNSKLYNKTQQDIKDNITTSKTITTKELESINKEKPTDTKLHGILNATSHILPLTNTGHNNNNIWNILSISNRFIPIFTTPKLTYQKGTDKQNYIAIDNFGNFLKVFQNNEETQTVNTYQLLEDNIKLLNPKLLNQIINEENTTDKQYYWKIYEPIMTNEDKYLNLSNNNTRLCLKIKQKARTSDQNTSDTETKSEQSICEHINNNMKYHEKKKKIKVLVKDSNNIKHNISKNNFALSKRQNSNKKDKNISNYMKNKEILSPQPGSNNKTILGANIDIPFNQTNKVQALEKNIVTNDSIVISPKVINEIAEKVKDIIMRDLKNISKEMFKGKKNIIIICLYYVIYV